MSEEEEEPRALERRPGEQAHLCSLPRLSPPPRALGTEGDAHKKPSLPFTSKETHTRRWHVTRSGSAEIPLGGG